MNYNIVLQKSRDITNTFSFIFYQVHLCLSEIKKYNHWFPSFRFLTIHKYVCRACVIISVLMFPISTEGPTPVSLFTVSLHAVSSTQQHTSSVIVYHLSCHCFSTLVLPQQIFEFPSHQWFSKDIFHQFICQFLDKVNQICQPKIVHFDVFDTCFID